jgi:hypothetical protein
MIPAAIAMNPFALMMDPSLVLDAMEHSAQLRNLRHRKYCPLDAPLIARRVNRDLEAFDVGIDAASGSTLDDAATDALIDAVLGMGSEPLLN